MTFLLVIIYPFVMFFSGFELTESLYTFLLAASVFMFYRSLNTGKYALYIFTGFCFGFATLCRPVAFGILVCFALYLFFGNSKGRFIKGLCMIAGAVLMIAPWTVRNYCVMHAFVPVNVMAGKVLWEGNNPQSDGGPCRYWPEEINNKSEIERDRILRAMAVEVIRQQPVRFLKLMGKKFIRFWNVIPNTIKFSSPRNILVMVCTDGLLLPLGALGILIGLTRKKKLLVLFFIVLAYTTLVHMVFLSSIRYRVPLMPFVIASAVYGLHSLAEAKRRKTVNKTETVSC